MERDPPRSLIVHRGKTPRVHPTAFIAPGARLIGDVTVEPQASIWYNCVLRAGLAPIVIGARTNVQDGTVIHVEGPPRGKEGQVLPTILGSDVLVGHLALLHGCVVEDGGFVGMGSIVMDGARAGAQAMLAAGALLPPRGVIPASELWVGRPARMARALRKAEHGDMRDQCAHYLVMAEDHLTAMVR